MKFAHILSEFYCQPWNIMPDKHRTLGELLQRHLRDGKLPEEPRWKPAASRAPGNDIVIGPVDGDGEPMIPQMQRVAGVAVIPVYGTLGRHLSFLSLWCGGCDYENVMQMVSLAEGDPSIHTILFDFDSPGGSNTGNGECASRLQGIEKRTIAYSDKTCCSAAYYLASQCDEVIFAPSSVVANVGSYIAAMDTSREWEMLGWKLELFRSGPYKAVGEDGKAWTGPERDFFQAQVTFAADKFKQAVKSARPAVVDDDLQGQWFFGEQAASRNLADGLADGLEQVVAAALT